MAEDGRAPRRPPGPPALRRGGAPALRGHPRPGGCWPRLADLVERTGARRRDDLLRVAVWRLDSRHRARTPACCCDAATQAFGRLRPASWRAGSPGRLTRPAAGTTPPSCSPPSCCSPTCRTMRSAVLDAVRPTARRRGGPLPPVRDVVVSGVWAGPSRAGRAAAAAAPVDAADRARMRAVEALMRLQLDWIRPAPEAGRRRCSDDPAAGAPPGSMARCVLAYLPAARRRPGRERGLLAAVEPERRGLARRHPACSTSLAWPSAPGQRRRDLAGIDAILAAEFADLAQRGGFGFGSGWASLLAGAGGLAARADRRRRCEAAEQACAALAANRLYAGTAHAARAHAAALRGDAELAAESMAAADRAGGSATAVLYPWRAQARAWTAACAGDLPGRACA